MVAEVVCAVVAVVRTGSGLRSDSVMGVAVAAGVACVTAEIVTLVGEGSVVGGVYKPVGEMVPVAVLPPAMLLTCQVTAVFVVLVTVAVNCTVDPRRVWFAPLMVIAGLAGVGVGKGAVGAVLLEQPAMRAVRVTLNKAAALFPHSLLREFEGPGPFAVIARSSQPIRHLE